MQCPLLVGMHQSTIHAFFHRITWYCGPLLGCEGHKASGHKGMQAADVELSIGHIEELEEGEIIEPGKPTMKSRIIPNALVWRCLHLTITCNLSTLACSWRGWICLGPSRAT